MNPFTDTVRNEGAGQQGGPQIKHLRAPAAHQHRRGAFKNPQVEIAPQTSSIRTSGVGVGEQDLGSGV